MNKVCFLTLTQTLLRSKKKKQRAIENITVSQDIFPLLGARIWVPILVYRYENPSGYVTEAV